MITIGRSFGIDSELLTPLETKYKFPFINDQIIEGSLYIPGSGVVNPESYCEALAKAAQTNGAKVSYRLIGTTVLGVSVCTVRFKKESSSYEGVELEDPEFKSNYSQNFITRLIIFYKISFSVSKGRKIATC